MLDIPEGDHSEDLKLNFLIAQATNIVEEVLNRPGFSLATRTQYYKGTGTQKLLLRSRPVYTTPTIQVFGHLTGFYGAPADAFLASTELFYGTDFTLQIDQDDGASSRSGLLLRMNDYWQKPTVRQAGLLSSFVGEGFGNYKITYKGGYTVDDLPESFRWGCNLLIQRMVYLCPIGMGIDHETFQERTISLVEERKDYLMSLCKPHIYNFRNWKW